jgi:hypothetical protein
LRISISPLPFDHSGAPGQSSAENYQQNQVTAPENSGTDGFIKRNGHGGGRGIPVFVKINEKLFRFCAETLADGVDDPSIGLMRYNTLDACDIDFASLHGFCGGCLHCLNGILESFFAFHSQVVQTRGDRFRRGRTTTTTTRHEQEIRFLAICPHDCREKSVRMRTILEHSSAGAVAKKNTRIAIFPIDN